MKDIKELIYAAVEENAVKFQELVNAQLQVRAYDAIEALRPEVGASMFGEAKKMEDDEEEMEDEDEDEEMEDEDEMDDKKKSMKEALHPNQQKIDVVDDEKIDAKDFAKLRKMKKEEVEGLDEISTDTLTKYTKAANASRASLNKKWTQGKASFRDKEKVMNREKGENRAHKIVDRRALVDKEMNEVAMPKNQADWQALITHQIQTTGHPVATDAQFRAQHGKDTSKIASLEPGEDKLQYATAQGGNVKQ
jgi:hypothetical protein